MWPGAGWVHAVFWNHADPRFEDPRVRRALTMAIDRAELYQLEAIPPETPIVDVVYTERQYLSGSVPDPLPHDDDGSRRLLEEAGWTVGTDGVRTREGERFQFTALVGSESVVGRAVYIQAQLREVGVQMDIQTLSGGIAGRLRAGDFQAAFGRFEPFQPGDIQWLRDRIALGYENPRVRELVDAAQATMNPVVEDSIYRLLMPIILADQPVTMLFPSIETFVASARITGLTSPYRSNPALFAEFLRLEGAPGNRSP
jgi:peptide/nickel transport system substrate-binding protein